MQTLDVAIELPAENDDVDMGKFINAMRRGCEFGNDVRFLNEVDSDGL